MKKIVIIMAITLGLLAITTNESYATIGTTNVSTTRLREEPNSDSKTLELISINEEVEIVSSEGDWFKVKYNDTEGYIFGELLNVSGEIDNSSNDSKENIENEEPEGDLPQNQPSDENLAQGNQNSNSLENLPANMKTKSEINVKITPLINSSNIGKIEGQKEVIVTELINDWCYIIADAISGWTRKANLTEITVELPVEPDEEQPNDNEIRNDIDVETKIGYVSATTLYVRQEPTTDSKILYTATRNQEVEITQDLDGWYAVNLKDIQGYVASRYISDTKVDTTSRGSNESRDPITLEDDEESSITDEAEKQEPIPEVNETENNQEPTPEVNEPEVNPEPTPEVNEPEVNPEPTPEVEAANDLGEQIVEFAKQYLGYKYVSGGTTPKGFDCSGFTQYVYANFGISITRTSKTQAKDGEYIEKDELQLGDLIIFNNTSNSSIGHVGIYVGNNSFIHAANEKKGVVITSLSDSYYKARYVSSRRVF